MPEKIRLLTLFTSDVLDRMATLSKSGARSTLARSGAGWTSVSRGCAGLTTLARVPRETQLLAARFSTTDLSRIYNQCFGHFSSDLSPFALHLRPNLSINDSPSSHLSSSVSWKAVMRTQVRWRSKIYGNKNQSEIDRDDEDGDDDDDEEEDDDDDDEEPVDLSLARNEKNLGGESKTMTKQLSGARAELAIAYVLGITHDEFLEIFYQGRVYLNGQLLQRKATLLERADKLDIVQETDEVTNSKVVIRIVVMEITRLPGAKKHFEKPVKMEMEVWKPGIRIKETG